MKVSSPLFSFELRKVITKIILDINKREFTEKFLVLYLSPRVLTLPFMIFEKKLTE